MSVENVLYRFKCYKVNIDIVIIVVHLVKRAIYFLATFSFSIKDCVLVSRFGGEAFKPFISFSLSSYSLSCLGRQLNVGFHRFHCHGMYTDLCSINCSDCMNNWKYGDFVLSKIDGHLKKTGISLLLIVSHPCSSI